MRWYKRNDDLSKDARVERRGEALWPMRARAAWPYLGSIRDVRADGAARAASRVSENKVTSLAALGTRRSRRQSNRFPHTSPLSSVAASFRASIPVPFPTTW